MVYTIIYLIGCYLAFVNMFNFAQNDWEDKSLAKFYYDQDMTASLFFCSLSWLILPITMLICGCFRHGLVPKKGFNDEDF